MVLTSSPYLFVLSLSASLLYRERNQSGFMWYKKLLVTQEEPPTLNLLPAFVAQVLKRTPIPVPGS
jgi:hypothetical protein